MFKNKRAALVLALVVFASFALTACGGSKKVDTDTLVVAQGADAVTLDPHANNDQPSARVMRQIYDTLLGMDEDMNVYPLLAESYENIDPLTWEFKLKEGVKFHDGNEMTADDVVFSIERHLESPDVSHILGLIDKVEKIDDYNVRIVTSEPFAAIERHLCHMSAGILSKESVEKHGAEFGQNPVGAGPYEFVEWQPGDSITLKRFEDYHGEAAKTENVVFRAVKEGTGRTVGLETGEISIAYDIDPVDIEQIKENAELDYIYKPSLSVDFIGMNNMKEPFTDVRVRRAMNHAINVQEILDTVLEGDGELAVSPLQKSVFGATTDVQTYEYDPEKAKALLAEAGYPNGFKTTISTDDGAVRTRISELVQGQLKEVGVEAEVDTMEWSKYLEMTGKGNSEMFILGWSTNTGDADYGLSAPFMTKNQGDAGNRYFYSNKEVDKLLTDAAHEIDTDKRKALYVKAQQTIKEDAPSILLFHKSINAGIQKDIKGFKIHPAGSHLLQYAYYDVEE